MGGPPLDRGRGPMGPGPGGPPMGGHSGPPMDHRGKQTKPCKLFKRIGNKGKFTCEICMKVKCVCNVNNFHFTTHNFMDEAKAFKCTCHS